MPYSPILSSPLFYLNVLLLAGAAAGLCLLAIWAGASRRHWFLRASGLLAGSLALWPVGAYAPLVLFLFVTPAIAVCILAARWWQSRRGPGADASHREPAFWRYRLHDLFLATVVVAVLAAVVAALARQQLSLVWRDFALIAATLVAVSLVAVALITFQRGKLWLLLALLSLIGAATGLHAWLLNDWRDLTDVLEAQRLHRSDFPAEGKMVILVSFCAFSLLVTLPLVLWRMGAPASRAAPVRPRRRARRYAACAGLALLAVMALGPLSVVYAYMLRGSPLPGEVFVPSNAYPRLLAIATRGKDLNVSGLSLDVLRQQRGGVEASAELGQLYREAMAILEKPARVVIKDGGDQQHISSLDWLGYCWIIEARNAAAAGRPDEGAEFTLAVMRLGNMMSRGGLRLHVLAGLEIDSVALSDFDDNSDGISLEKARRIMAALDEADACQEAMPIIVARERAWREKFHGWPWRFTHAVARLTGRDPEAPITRLLASEVVAVRAGRQLLMTKLAIRLFRESHGRLPEELDELVPEFLAEPPLDPFSGQPLIYRRDGEDYLLYSMGPDGRDDGGNFRMWHKFFPTSEGLDFDLGKSLPL